VEVFSKDDEEERDERERVGEVAAARLWRALRALSL
jgi:hypothetical protein